MNLLALHPPHLGKFKISRCKSKANKNGKLADKAAHKKFSH